jgi:TRAP-type transport system small permease protein
MLGRLVGGFDRATAFISCALVVALLVCVSLGVITRTLGAPLIWTDEFSRFLMVWLAVFGGILASRKRLHVRIRFLQDLLPARGHQAVELALQVAVTLFGAMICAFSVGLVNKNLDLEATSLSLSMSWMYVPMVLAGLVFAVQGASEVVKVLQRPRPRPPIDPETAVE